MADDVQRTAAFNQSPAKVSRIQQKSNGSRSSNNTYNDKPIQSPSVWPPQPLFPGQPRIPEPINLNLDDDLDGMQMPPREKRGFVGTLTRSLSNSAKKMGFVHKPGRRVVKLRSCVVCLLLLIAALLTSGLGVLVFLYGRCPLSEVLTTRPKWGQRECQPWLMVENDELALDSSGRWETEVGHQAARALWRVHFVGYTSDQERFQSNMREVMKQLQGKLKGLQGRRYYEVLQDLAYSNMSATGATGHLSLKPNLDLQSIIAGRLADHAQARDLSIWMGSTKSWPRSDDDVAEMTSGRFPSECREKTVVHGRNKVQVQHGLMTSLIDPEGDFVRGNYIEFLPLKEGGDMLKNRVRQKGGCYEYKIPVESSTKRPERLGVALLGDIAQYLGPPGLFILQLDVQQAFAMDWCNRERESCLAAACKALGSKACNTTAPPQASAAAPAAAAAVAAVAAFPPLNGSTSRFPPVFSTQLNMYGFLWHVGKSGSAASVGTAPPNSSTSTSGSTPKSPGRTAPDVPDSTTTTRYLVVPELLPTTSCATCNSTPSFPSTPQAHAACQTFLGIELHYFKYQPLPSSEAVPDLQYQTSFEYNIHTDGGLLVDGADAIVHCNASSMGFASDPDALTKAMGLPRRVENGVFRCKLPLCAGALEKMALVFAGVTGLYVVVGTILVVVCAGRKKAQVVGGVTDLEDNFWQVARK